MLHVLGRRVGGGGAEGERQPEAEPQDGADIRRLNVCVAMYVSCRVMVRHDRLALLGNGSVHGFLHVRDAPGGDPITGTSTTSPDRHGPCPPSGGRAGLRTGVPI
ncbi:hypothetical protein [Streptomyces sp. NPDC012508]|uniref:hypothetical protein n=1 Tax=Streptomyces sp. NPDC012508 TaxID=3364837 RepID=UPI0036BB49FE